MKQGFEFGLEPWQSPCPAHVILKKRHGSFLSFEGKLRVKKWPINWNELMLWWSTIQGWRSKSSRISIHWMMQELFTLVKESKCFLGYDSFLLYFTSTLKKMTHLNHLMFSYSADLFVKCFIIWFWLWSWWFISNKVSNWIFLSLFIYVQ